MTSILPKNITRLTEQTCTDRATVTQKGERLMQENLGIRGRNNNDKCLLMKIITKIETGG